MFDDVYPLIEQSMDFPTDSITGLNYNTLQNKCKYIGINTLLDNGTAKYHQLEDSLVNYASLDKYKNVEKKTIRVMEICKKENANILHNAIGGMNLYSKEFF